MESGTLNMKENVLHKVLMGKSPPPPSKITFVFLNNSPHLEGTGFPKTGTERYRRIPKNMQTKFLFAKKNIGISFLFNKLIHERLNPPENYVNISYVELFQEAKNMKTGFDWC